MNKNKINNIKYIVVSLMCLILFNVILFKSNIVFGANKNNSSKNVEIYKNNNTTNNNDNNIKKEVTVTYDISDYTPKYSLGNFYDFLYKIVMIVYDFRYLIYFIFLLFALLSFLSKKFLFKNIFLTTIFLICSIVRDILTPTLKDLNITQVSKQILFDKNLTNVLLIFLIINTACLISIVSTVVKNFNDKT